MTLCTSLKLKWTWLSGSSSQPIAEYIPTPTAKKKDKEDKNKASSSSEKKKAVKSKTPSPEDSSSSDVKEKHHHNHHHHHHHHKEHHRHHHHKEHHGHDRKVEEGNACLLSCFFCFVVLINSINCITKKCGLYGNGIRALQKKFYRTFFIIYCTNSFLLWHMGYSSLLGLVWFWVKYIIKIAIKNKFIINLI